MSKHDDDTDQFDFDAPTKRNSVPPLSFQVGDGVSMCYLNDIYPGTIRRISKSGHMIWVSQDRVAKAEFDPSFGPRARAYEPIEMPEEDWRCFTRRKDGRYREKGHRSPYLHSGRSFSQPREI